MGSSRIISKYTVQNLCSRYGQLHPFFAVVRRSQAFLQLFLMGSSLAVSEPGWTAPLQKPFKSEDSYALQHVEKSTAIALQQAPFLNEVLAQAHSKSSQSITSSDLGLSKEAVSPFRPSSKAGLLSAIDSRKASDLLASRYSPSASPPNWVIATSQPLPLLEENTYQSQPSPSNSLKQQGEPPPQPRILSSTIPPNSAIVAADPGSPTPPPIPACPNPDPELGCLYLQDPIFPTNPPPILYLIPRIDFFRSNNILLGIDPIDDGLIRPTLTLLAVPPLGRNTYLIASVEGAFNRYFEVPRFNYDEFRVRAGISQRLSPTMWAELGWTNQQLFISGSKIPGFPSGTRFLNDQALRFEVSRRDQLNNRLALTSLYQLRVGFAKPSDRSRILNVLYLSLGYDVKPTVQLGLDYQFAAANYTVVKRSDIYQQLLGRITFSAFRNTQLSVYGGISFGNSTERGINFDSYILGVSMSVNLVLF
ncbi:MAG: hypothetical protein IGS48_22965 [Oscillatoriales cyanobacterium C42_A2020_001]|nr:hypothetical protein [Leptolyngbyaceae cyanobacterium C42_A2020_001]